jgi:hypothetical protein
MKKLLFSIFSLAIALVAFAFLVKPSFADVGDITIWNLKGTYTIDFTCIGGCSGDYIHTLNVTSMNDNTGDFSGTGFYNDDNSFTWTITGKVIGSSNALTFHVVYTGGNSGYVIDGTGNVNYDGILSGTATGPGQTFSFKSTSGKAHHERIHVRQEVNKKQCDAKGKAIVDVNERVLNDADSGFAGYWAFDNYTRNIKVWKNDDGNYCANVTYGGKFDAVDGNTGPAGSGTIGFNVHGTFDGGYRSIPFTGTLLSTPGWPTHGNIGPIDYKCTLLGYCSGYVDWVSKYFNSTTSFEDAWWGWTYRAGKNGTWINASNGNSGNITGDGKPLKATGDITMGGPSQRIDFSAFDFGNTTPDKGKVEYWNYDYKNPGPLHYKANVLCATVDELTDTARFMFQIPSGWNGLSGLYVVAYVKDGGTPGIKGDLYGHAATGDSTTALGWCETGTGFAPGMYPVTGGNLSIH